MYKRQVPQLCPAHSQWRIRLALLGRILQYGAVTALQQAVQPVCKVLIQGQVNALGVQAIAAFNAVTRVEDVYKRQMFLSASGGLQDAYTYIGRGKVFANAQTGNIVLMSQAAFDGDLARVLHYLIPLLSFALGVAVAEAIHIRYLSLIHIYSCKAWVISLPRSPQPT